MHYSEYLQDPQGYIKAMTGTDPDLAAHLMILTKAGQVLTGLPIATGPPIAVVFGPVPAADYWQSICADVANAPQEIVKQPMYTILNLCQVLAYRRDRLILSKAEGGQWGLRHLPSQFYPLIEAALEAYCEASSVKLARYTDEELSDFAARLLAQIELM